MGIQTEVLERIHYFSGLSAVEYDAIKQVILQKAVEKGEVFLIEGEWSDFVYFVISGAVKVYKTSADGREQYLNIAHLGESLNDVSAFDGAPSAASMLAMTPVILYQIRKSDLKDILRKYPQVALNALEVLAGRVRRDSLLVEDLSFTQVTGRLAKMLLKRGGEEADNGLRLTQQDMAAMVGTAREVVNRSLKFMEEKGAIRLERHGIVVTNKEVLEEMVKASS